MLKLECLLVSERWADVLKTKSWILKAQGVTLVYAHLPLFKRK